MKEAAQPCHATDLFSAVQNAVLRLERIRVGGDGVAKALLQGGSPTKPDDLRERFEAFLNEHRTGKDASKLRLVVE